MKSAYELAMERLEKSAPSEKLSDSQKQQIGEIDDLYRSKIAERELFLQDQIAKSRGDSQAVRDLEKQLALEVRRLKEECEDKKDRIRNLG